MRVRGMTLYRNTPDFIPLTVIPLTDLVFSTPPVAPKYDEGRWRREKPVRADMFIVS